MKEGSFPQEAVLAFWWAKDVAQSRLVRVASLTTGRPQKYNAPRSLAPSEIDTLRLPRTFPHDMKSNSSSLGFLVVS